nr:calcium uptake protein 3, mitochondrial-like isoform X3 [Oncorhynchus nerka]
MPSCWDVSRNRGSGGILFLQRHVQSKMQEEDGISLQWPRPAPCPFRCRSTAKGIIAYTEYLFLLCILTKPHAGFKIAFNMFDADGNQMVDKREFLVLQEIFRKKNEKKGRKGDVEKSAQLSMQLYGYQGCSHQQRG